MEKIDKIVAENLGKRYNRDWIFRDFSKEFLRDRAYAILGHNGSGKSTFIQVIAGNMFSSSGSVNYFSDGAIIQQETIYKKISFSAPYLELIEEYTLSEAIEFQAKFKGFIHKMSTHQVLEESGLIKESSKQIRYFSSGMKQRVKLTLSILSDCPVLFLDEPGSNLDKKGVEWYQALVNKYRGDRIIFVCSNQQANEFDFCEEVLNIEDYKKKS